MTRSVTIVPCAHGIETSCYPFLVGGHSFCPARARDNGDSSPYGHLGRACACCGGGPMTLDDRKKPGGRDRLGPGETLLLEAADGRFAYHGSSADKVGEKLLAQAREKLPEPEHGTGGELIQPRGASTYLYNTLDYPDFIAADASAQRMTLAIRYAELLRQPLPDNLTAPLRASEEPSPRDVLEGAVAVLRSESPVSSDAMLTALLPKAKSA